MSRSPGASRERPTDPRGETSSAPLRVAFQGELGAFSDEAVRAFFGPGAEPVPRRDFREVGEAVRSGVVAWGLLPVENTVAGSVAASYDVLAHPDLRVRGEVILSIRHHVLGPAGAVLEGVRRVLSHPVALAQCGRFLSSRPGLEAVAVYDTAGAAREVAERGDPEVAAIAARGAAERYGLRVLASDVQDRADNQTRFLVVARREGPPLPPTAPGGPARTALLVETPNEPGALLAVLLPFARRGLNLTKLESRPGTEPWTYRFFLEFEADAAEPGAARALREVRAAATSLRVLGSYPAWREGGRS